MRARTNFPTIPLHEVPVYESLQSPEGHCPAILVVDDEHVIADSLCLIFNKNGFSALAAYNGATALKLATEFAPDLLITDVVMPGMSGIDLAIAMRQLCPNCEVLLFSGQASTLDLLASAREAGHSFETLTKPIHPVAMLQKAGELIPARAFAG